MSFLVYIHIQFNKRSLFNMYKYINKINNTIITYQKEV